MREIENENAVFARWKTKKWVKKLRKGIFRVGVWHVLRLGRSSFELRSGMYCTSVRHLSQCLKWNTELRKFCEVCKVLIVNKMRKCAKNRVFRPKHFVVEKKCVDWCIDCCEDLRINAILRWPSFPWGILGFASAPIGCQVATHRPSQGVKSNAVGFLKLSDFKSLWYQIPKTFDFPKFMVLDS